MTPATKPCACGRPGCIAVQREREWPADFRGRRYASRSCARWHRNMVDPRMTDARRKAGHEALLTRGYASDDGGLVTPVEWLDQPPVRLRLQRLAQGVSV